MNATLHAGMLEATRLTRAGQLLGATAIIQPKFLCYPVANDGT